MQNSGVRSGRGLVAALVNFFPHHEPHPDHHFITPPLSRSSEAHDCYFLILSQLRIIKPATFKDGRAISDDRDALRAALAAREAEEWMLRDRWLLSSGRLMFIFGGEALLLLVVAIS